MIQYDASVAYEEYCVALQEEADKKHIKVRQHIRDNFELIMNDIMAIDISHGKPLKSFVLEGSYNKITYIDLVTYHHGDWNLKFYYRHDNSIHDAWFTIKIYDNADVELMRVDDTPEHLPIVTMLEDFLGETLEQ